MDESEDKRKAGKIGGTRRAQLLPAERRAEIARQAAISRWAGRPVRATHRGNFKDEFGIDVDCYVLDDDQKTAVISQRGMGAAIGIDAKRSAALPRFVNGGKIAPYIGGELRENWKIPWFFRPQRWW